MAKSQNKETPQVELPINSLLLECTKDRYKLSYAALRWAKEIKKVENLPDSIPSLAHGPADRTSQSAKPTLSTSNSIQAIGGDSRTTNCSYPDSCSMRGFRLR